MMNQEAFEAARAGDWVAETFTRSGDVFSVSGSSTGYSTFGDALDDGASVFYAAFDENDNREAGLAVWDKGTNTLTPVEIHATLIGGAFIKGDPDPLNFPDGGTITGTLNATAFNTIWKHVFEQGNPHGTTAGDIDSNMDDKSVEEILRTIVSELNDHVGSSNNPHNVDATQVAQNNDQNDLGFNVQNALNKLNQNLTDHEASVGNVHDVKANHIDTAPEIELADGPTVQHALETLYKCFKESEFGDDHLQLIEADGDETIITIKRISSEDVPATTHHGGMDQPAPTDASGLVGELMWEQEGEKLWTSRADGTLICIGGADILFDAPSDGLAYSRKDGEWFAITPTLVQDLPPENPTAGSLWADTGKTAELYVWDGLQWVSMTGGGNGGQIGASDNNTEDNIPADLEDKGLVRTITAQGVGEWRQPTTADIVAVGEEPVLLSPSSFNKDAGEVTTQQEANWYLYNSITGGEGTGGLFVKKAGDTMTGNLFYRGGSSEDGTFHIGADTPQNWDKSTYYGIQIDLTKGTTFRNRFTINTTTGRSFEINGNGESNFVNPAPRMPDRDVAAASSDKDKSYGLNVGSAKAAFIGKRSGVYKVMQPWQIKSDTTDGTNSAYNYIDIQGEQMGLYHVKTPSGSNGHHAANVEYVNAKIDDVEVSIDNLGNNFMPRAGGEFTGEVKYSNVNDNSAAPTTLMHKAAFDSVLSKFEMGDRKYHSIYVNKAMHPTTTPISIKSTSSNDSTPDFKIMNNSSYNYITMQGQTGCITSGRSQNTPYMAEYAHEVTTLAKVEDMIEKGGSGAKSANKVFEYSDASGGSPNAGMFNFKSDTQLQVDHRERIDGSNIEWCPINDDRGDKTATGTYSIYKTENGNQVLQEWGTYDRIRMGYKPSGYNYRHSEFRVNRQVKIRTLNKYTLYSLVISGLF